MSRSLEHQLYEVARQPVLDGAATPGEVIVKLFAVASFISLQTTQYRSDFNPNDELEAMRHALDRAYSFYLNNNPPRQPEPA